jgi:hypothetical protein
MVASCRSPGRTKPGQSEVRIMKDVKDMLRIVGIILLGIFVLAVGVPLVFAAAGVVLGGIIGITVSLIKIAVVLAVAYLILVGIRAILK